MGFSSLKSIKDSSDSTGNRQFALFSAVARRVRLRPYSSGIARNIVSLATTKKFSDRGMNIKYANEDSGKEKTVHDSKAQQNWVR